MVSALDDTARTTLGVVGQSYWGFRLHPGARVDEAALLLAIGSRQFSDPYDALEQVDELVRIDSGLADALHVLQHSASVEVAASALGVSQRSLQRLVSMATGRPPGYWRGLARARRAAQVLAHAPPGGPSLVQVAADHGYADQAHMTRAFRRWFGCTPSGLQASANLCELVSATGYG
jgi:AraC-like DNA-binding protein